MIGSVYTSENEIGWLKGQSASTTFTTEETADIDMRFELRNEGWRRRRKEGPRRRSIQI